MGHHITALVGRLPINDEAAEQYDLPVFKEAGFAIIIGLNASHSDFWFEKLGIPEIVDWEIILDCATTHFFASAIFGDVEYAIVETDYFGGIGVQAAAVYQPEKEIMATERGETGPINKALRLVGVKRSKSKDEFDTIGLGEYRSFDEAFEKYWE